MKKALLTAVLLVLSTHSFARDYKIDLGKIQEFEIMVSCSSDYNGGVINAKSIIESFQVLGTNEEDRYRKSGCQSHQSYPLFVEGNELHMWVKWIDGSSDDEQRYADMRAAGSIVLGKLTTTKLPNCDNGQWFNRVKVKAVADLKIYENIKKLRDRNSYSHNLSISNNKYSIETIGWITRRARSSEREDRFCYYRR